MNMELQILAAAANLQRLRPELRPVDWTILGLIADHEDGYKLADLRKERALVGSTTTFLPALERLTASGLITSVKTPQGHVIYRCHRFAQLDPAEGVTAPAAASANPAAADPRQMVFVL